MGLASSWATSSNRTQPPRPRTAQRATEGDAVRCSEGTPVRYLERSRAFGWHGRARPLRLLACSCLWVGTDEQVDPSSVGEARARKRRRPPRELRAAFLVRFAGCAKTLGKFHLGRALVERIEPFEGPWFHAHGSKVPLEIARSIEQDGLDASASAAVTRQRR